MLETDHVVDPAPDLRVLIWKSAEEPSQDDETRCAQR
jgi:hypothetical protein